MRVGMKYCWHALTLKIIETLFHDAVSCTDDIHTCADAGKSALVEELQRKYV